MEYDASGSGDCGGELTVFERRTANDVADQEFANSATREGVDSATRDDVDAIYDESDTGSGRNAGEGSGPVDRRLRELERENERLGRLFDVLEHDLRNHLSVAEGRLELATLEPNDEHLQDVARAHDRMSELLEDLLAAREEGFGVGEPRAVALTTCVDRAWSAIAPGDAALVVDGNLTLSADPDRLTQLLENLFRNAVEHGSADRDPENCVDAGLETTDRRTSVTVRVGRLPDQSGFFVEDDGCGLPAAARERLFEEGYSTAEEGMGLGLTIVQDVVTGHGWSIDATTGAAGGARFEISGVERPSGRADDPPEG